MVSAERVAIARALAAEPKLIVLDEPMSALDVSVRAQIVNLLLDLQETLGLAYVFVGHDLAIARYMCHRVAVMRRGSIVETGTADDVLHDPQHEYTAALLKASYIDKAEIDAATAPEIIDDPEAVEASDPAV